MMDFINLLADRHDLEVAMFEWACEWANLDETGGTEDAKNALVEQIDAARVELETVDAEIAAWRSAHR